MAKSYRLKNNDIWENYWHSDVCRITKTLKMTEANVWYDTGIAGADLPTGTYIIQVYLDGQSTNNQWNEYMAGVMVWYTYATNSDNYDIIPLAKAGHARNNHNIQLRILRQRNSHIKLQMMDTIAWTGNDNVIFSFRQVM